MTSIWRKGIVVAVAALGGMWGPVPAEAQQAAAAQYLYSGHPDQPDMLIQPRSLFDLGAEGDEAVTGVRATGPASWCVTNINGFAQYFNFGCGSPQYTRNQAGGYNQTYFDLGLTFAAPAGDLPSVIDPAASGLRGGGYTHLIATALVAMAGGGNKLNSSDRTGSELLALGVQTTNDGSCQNFQPTSQGGISAGFQIMPMNDCPATIPAAGWKGRRPIPVESFQELMATDPEFQGMNDPFAFWRVPEEFQDTEGFLGDWQTYGEITDFYFQALARYGAVVPGGSGTPAYQGWPMGLTVFYDAFFVGLPNTSNALFWQGTIVNESEKVYGVGMTYDSLYIGIYHNPLIVPQSSAHYFDSKRSAILFNNTGGGCIGQPATPGSGCPNIGFAGGSIGAGVLVLKSPLGDMRYKLLSDPDSEFFDPTHPLAGDTITFNHQRQCGFGGCYPRTLGRSQRAAFGFWSSTGRNALDGEQPGDLDDVTYHRIFRAEDWPVRTGEFNKYVPGVDDDEPIWDWNKDGIPDTIYADSCGSRGCVDIWSDTLANGGPNNIGNIAGISIGPVRIGPNDTVPLVFAAVGGADEASIEAAVNNTLDFYKGFYLGPEPAPAPRFTAADVAPGDARDASITLFFDNTTEEWTDPFLATLNVAAELELNPWLADSLAARVSDNVAAIHVFKSCDGGTRFTRDADCDGDPVFDPTSKWSGFGWQPYATIEPEDGRFPNQFTDNNVFAGITYTYVLVTETRGATFNLVRDAGGGVLVAEQVEFAPSLLSPLSAASTNPNVSLVYVPVNLAAGARAAELGNVTRVGNSDVPVNVRVIGSAPRGGDYRTVFVDSVEVRTVQTLDAGRVVGTQTTVTGWVLRTVSDDQGAGVPTPIRTFTFSRSGGISSQGLTETGRTETEDQRTVVLSGGFGMVLADAQNRPLLASTTLTGAAATPGSFIGSEDFPFFVLSVNQAQGGTFASETWVGPDGDTITSAVAPSPRFVRSGTVQSAHLRGRYGTFEFTWGDDPWGPGVPFQVTDRGGIQNAVTQSLTSRATASTSSTSAEALEAIQAADPSATLTAADLREYRLPFTVRNAQFDRDVEVVVASHASGALLGQGNDSIRVDVPADTWIPGDILYFVEQVQRERSDANGNTILGPDGQPEMETIREATFRVAMGCLAPRLSCDPTVGGAASSAYVAYQPGSTYDVRYFVPLRGGDEVNFQVRAAVTAQEAVAAGAVPLDRVHVVPNPYVFATEYERATAERVLKFTALPPAGRIRIFDVAGRFVQQIDYTPDDLQGGDLNWDMQTRENLELGSGLYIFVLEDSNSGDRKMGKFVVIR